MSKLLLPLILIGAAVGLFVLYTNPTYQGVKMLGEEVKAYDDALSKSQELKRKRDELISRRNTFESTDIQKLEKILPDNVDNIRLVIDINNIAARHGLTLTNVELGSISDSTDARGETAVGASGSKVGSVELGFSLSATYENMLAFIVDLEHSLRVIDIEGIGFQTSGNDQSIHSYTFLIRTYWLH